MPTSCAVTIAVTRNVTTARIDGSWNEPIPQMPWPDVQPLLMRAPKPAMNPPTASCQSATCVRNVMPSATVTRNSPPPSTRPTASASLQPRVETS